MRITNKMSTSSVLKNIEKNTESLMKTNEKLSSGKRIGIPQDDPIGAVKAMGYRSNIGEIEQYITNVNNAGTFLNATDVAVGQVTDILQRSRELAVQAANDSLDQTSRDAVADEITQLLDEVIGLANSKVGDRYIFGGFETTEAPFKKYTGLTDATVGGSGGDLTDASGNVRTGINNKNTTVVTYKGDSGDLLAEIDEGVVLSHNLAGESVFFEGQDVFKTLMDLRDSIYKGEVNDADGDDISIENQIDGLDGAIKKMLRNRAEVGAKMHRLEQAGLKLENQKINVTDLLAKTEDTDVTKAIMDLKTQESVQKLSLDVGARIIQPTLMDFLR